MFYSLCTDGDESVTDALYSFPFVNVPDVIS